MSAPSKDRIILGLMTFGREEKWGARITDLDAFKETLDVFKSRGYSELDTARAYIGGQQEAFSREAGWREKGFKMATKVMYPLKPGVHSADKIVEWVETSLKELGTDCIDILYLHAPDRATPFTETLSALDKLHKQGKFSQLGLSNFAAFEVAEVVMTCRHNGWVRPTVYQGVYNAITRTIEPELLPALRRYGMDLVVYNPLAGGLLTGAIKSRDVAPSSGRFSDESVTGAHYRARYFRASTFEALRAVEAAAEEAGLGMVETALRWLVHHSALRVKGGNDGVIVGVSSIAQLRDNLDHLEKGPLPQEVVDALDRAWDVSRLDTADYWHLGLEYGYDTREALFGADGQ
ncbi:hypothetical protein MCOR31_002108 [Pyricularia oryzae]|nr:hypothetical protein MCOR30_005738 [Pyricularia oryzae]KAI6375602.1 hypothetical protein MCOR31_002108 [Pyricularia oryzae]KAI6419338.1 hypothetical protein MCOR21_010335 [Pyricularia oryzae]KAI6443599.1 hypothetical protein MCOR22_005229 [Pyricularia oryzae]